MVRGQRGYEIGVGVGIGSVNAAGQAVVNVGDRKDEADPGRSEEEGAQQGDGVGSSGDGDGEAQAGAQVPAVQDRSCGDRSCGDRNCGAGTRGLRTRRCLRIRG